MSLPLPHPNKAAVDAGSSGALKFVADMRKLTGAERPTLADLDPIQRLTVANCALEVLNACYAQVGAQVARAIVTDLDGLGLHDAANRVAMIADSWVSARVPDTIEGLF